MDYLDKEVSLKQIQKRLKAVIHEEVEDGNEDSELLLDRIDSIVPSSIIVEFIL